MNPVTEALPPLLLQPHRPSTSCDRHPEERFTGFCPTCLCERLAVLEPSSSSSTSSSSRKPPINSSAAAAALKAIFRPSAGGGGPSAASGWNKPSSFLPELRRTKSFSASKNEGFSGVFEPQRKSCDVRVRNTLWTLFSQDDERKPLKNEAPRVNNGGGVHIEDEPRNLASSSVVRGPVLEPEEEEEDDETEPEIEISGESDAGNVVDDRVQEIQEEEDEDEEEEEENEEPSRPEIEPVQDDFKRIKDHIDLDSQPKKPSGRDFKEIAGSFWSAASVFSKKWQKWRDKQKLKKSRNGGGSATLPVEKPIGRQFRETQSEIADYGYGRRSCDTDPRFSLDAGRMSFDDPRYSFDEPRASWDGYLVSRTFTRMPTMLSVVEDAPIHVSRTDTQIPVEEPAISGNDDETVPGGSEQTRDYYSDSSRRRRSLDRSSSLRKTAAAVVADMDEIKSSSNAKVSPATADFFSGPKLVVPDKVLRDSNTNSLRDDCSETFEIPFRNVDRKEAKKSRRWGKGWNILAFIHRRASNKYEDEDRYSTRTNGVTRSLSESWPEFRGERNGEVRGIGGGMGFNPKMMRSNSSVSWRSLQNNNGGSFGSMRKSNVETSSGFFRKKKEDFVLERNHSARFSTNDVVDNGLLRFYVTPMKGSRRGEIVKNRPNPAQSIARSVLRLY
ncbi:UPF0503 protein At3g09070, chloroplastic-like [Cucurbita pepo subsp. pepo]|uniref:UPF0503 protein At3g09070, chloroplastic-like n=1 Tax=Cucurbita pepo subsp. pepo TaxID=3664 RepID=UPI000C9D57FA|nr:UPF0503 protein At3g09070, chloroplastic-like [Cucurbita pepo subsp. pepo]